MNIDIAGRGIDVISETRDGGRVFILYIFLTYINKTTETETETETERGEREKIENRRGRETNTSKYY